MGVLNEKRCNNFIDEDDDEDVLRGLYGHDYGGSKMRKRKSKKHKTNKN